MKIICFGVFFLFFVCKIHAQSIPFENFTVKDGLTSNTLYDAIFDVNGTLWVGTENGVSEFDGFTFTNHTVGKKEKVLGFFSLPNHEMGFYTSANHLFYIKKNQFIPSSYNDSLTFYLKKEVLNTVIATNHDSIWVSTFSPQSLFLFVKGSVHTYNMNSSRPHLFVKQIGKSHFISGAIQQKEISNKLYIELNTRNFTIPLSSAEQQQAKSFSILLNDESILYARNKELIRIKNQKVAERIFVDARILRIFQMSNGKLWVGLENGGALCYPESKLTSVGVLNYLGERSVSSIIEDAGGNIWFTTLEDGLFFLPSIPITNYSPPKVFSSDNKSISTLQSISSKSNTQNPIEGKMLSITESEDTLKPMVYISGVKILEKDTAVLASYILPYWANFLKINFAGISFNDSEQLQYKYQLTGIDKDWVYTNSAFSQYTTLPPGEYMFSVYSMNKHGLWSNQPATIYFNITPPFWSTWLFYALGFFITGSVIFIIAFLRIRTIKRREKQNSKITRQIARLELQALRAQMNPHFIFNTLSSIQYFITEHNTEEAIRYLSKFAKLMRQIMGNSSLQVIPVKDEIDALKLYLELESLRFKDKFDYEINVSETIDQNFDEIPAMLIQPYVENAILHGILHKPSKGHIAITLTKNATHICCAVKDNGIGRDKAREINKNKFKDHESAGMNITKHRLQILNASRKSTLSVAINDMKDEHNNALGTEI